MGRDAMKPSSPFFLLPCAGGDGGFVLCKGGLAKDVVLVD